MLRFRSLFLLIAIGMSGCAQPDNGGAVATTASLGLNPMDQVFAMPKDNDIVMDKKFLEYLKEIQGDGDYGNWQGRPYDHYAPLWKIPGT
jgi:hypothetical protein